MPSFIAAGLPVPAAADLAWLSLIPVTTPGLSADERAKVTAIRAASVDARTTARCDLLLAT